MSKETMVEIKKENDSLRKDMEDLKKMMMEMMKNQTPEKKDIKKSTFQDEDEDEDETIEIAPNTLIYVSSLFFGGLTLIGAHGKTIRFERFGQKMPITFEDLNYAVSNNRYVARDGYCFIHNDDAIKLLYLQEEYKKIISPKKVENIINLSNEEIEEVYTSVSKNLKSTIMDCVIRGIQKNKPKYQDRNKISFISKLFGKDLEVIARDLPNED